MLRIYTDSSCFKNAKSWDLPGGPMAGTLSSQCWGPGFGPSSGYWIPHAATKTWPSQKNNFFKKCHILAISKAIPSIHEFQPVTEVLKRNIQNFLASDITADVMMCPSDLPSRPKHLLCQLFRDEESGITLITLPFWGSLHGVPGQ